MNCCMPAVVSRTVGSLCGIRDALEKILWTRFSKKSRKRLRISLLCIHAVRGKGALVVVLCEVRVFDAQIFDRPTQEAGDVHLAHAYVVGDLGLRLALV